MKPVIVQTTLLKANFRVDLNNSNCKSIRIVVDMIKTMIETKDAHRTYRNSKFKFDFKKSYTSMPAFILFLETIENSDCNNNVVAVVDVTIDDKLKQKLSSDDK
mmetsp:Transcript_58293/g.65253  ORF Transcript_58293/g.65253 Transcript_58293/m.65253 type:complete len:104 (-) Transcript_58293:403-714(-)